jgi:hypothetical protein
MVNRLTTNLNPFKKGAAMERLLKPRFSKKSTGFCIFSRRFRYAIDRVLEIDILRQLLNEFNPVEGNRFPQQGDLRRQSEEADN